MIAPPPAQRFTALPARQEAQGSQGSKDEPAHLVAPLFEQAMSDLRQRDPERFSARVRELGKVLETCEAGMRTKLGAGRATPAEALAVLAGTPADALFRRGFRAAG